MDSQPTELLEKHSDLLIVPSEEANYICSFYEKGSINIKQILENQSEINTVRWHGIKHFWVISRVTDILRCKWHGSILWNSLKHTFTHTQNKEPIESSVVIDSYNKGKLKENKKESIHQGPKSSWIWTFDSCLQSCLLEIVTLIPSNKTPDCIHASRQLKGH